MCVQQFWFFLLLITLSWNYQSWKLFRRPKFWLRFYTSFDLVYIYILCYIKSFTIWNRLFHTWVVFCFEAFNHFDSIYKHMPQLSPLILSKWSTFTFPFRKNLVWNYWEKRNVFVQVCDPVYQKGFSHRFRFWNVELFDLLYHVYSYPARVYKFKELAMEIPWQ